MQIYINPNKQYLDELLDILSVFTTDMNKIEEDIDFDKFEPLPIAKTSNRKPKKKMYPMPSVDKILFRDPATIVWFTDGTKSVAICGHDDTYDKETGVAICLCKRMLGNKEYRELMDDWCYKKENSN